MNPPDDALPEPPEPQESILERWPSWTWLGVLVGIVAAVWLLTLIDRGLFYDGFVKPYWLDPILGDTGYNAVNTAALILPLLLLLLWAYAFLKELDERVGFSLIVAVIPIMVLGSVYRVLEDADLFAPYGGSESCVPDAAGGFFETCFGIVFITPIIWVLAALMAGGMLWMGHQAKRVAERYTVAKGLQYYAMTLVAVVLLYAAMWSYEPGFIRYLHHPIWLLLAATVCYLLVHQHTRATKRIEPHAILFGYGVFVLLFGLMYVLDWIMGGDNGADWGPATDDQVRAWVWLVLIISPLLITWATMAIGRVLANRRPWGRRGPEVDDRHADTSGSAAGTLTALILLLLAVSVGAFVMAVGASEVEELWRDGTPVGLGGGWLAAVSKILVGPAAFVLAIEAARRMVAAGFPVHANLIFYAAPVNLVMVFGQMADAVMTALGIDVYDYSEKHVLPSFLIEGVAGANLPYDLSSWAATIVMLPLKLIIVLLVVWVIDVQVQEPRKNLIGLIKLAIIMVGLSPAIRNATRLAMGT